MKCKAEAVTIKKSAIRLNALPRLRMVLSTRQSRASIKNDDMKNKKLLFGIAILFLTSLFVLIWNNYRIQILKKPVGSIRLPSAISGKCGIENCHGLDISCGPNIPEACDTMYVAGDNCRQFATCEKKDGKCQFVQSSGFENCKVCVEKCEQSFSNDPIEFSQCEIKCTQ